MKFIIQRVSEASVTVEGQVIGQIGKGYLVLIGVGENDTKELADRYIKKMLGLRIFEDENGKTNLSLKDVGGSLLLVSQFTQTAVRGTVQASQRPVIPSWQKSCMSISLHSAERKFLKCRQEVSGRI